MWKSKLSRSLLIATAMAVVSVAANAQTAAVTDRPWDLYRGTSKVGAAAGYPSKAECAEAARLMPAPPASTVQRYGCRTISDVVVTQPPATTPVTWTRVAIEGGSFSVPANSVVRYGAPEGQYVERSVSGDGQCTTVFFGGNDPAWGYQKFCEVRSGSAPPPSCPPARDPLVETIACPAGTTGTQTRTTTFTRGAPTACADIPGTPVVTGTCTPVVTPPPPTSGLTYYFSDCQAGAAEGCVPGSNANPGTSETAPKQNLSGMNLNALPAGTRLLLKRGGAWRPGMITLDNPNTTAASPLTLDAYGTGPAPVVAVPSGNLFNLGGGWNNTSNDGGYVIRNLKLDGLGTAEWGVWFVLNVRDVVLENNEITGFRIAINSNDGAPYGVSGITLRNNNIHHNRAMGLLGHYDNTLLEGNLFEANNFSGSNFDHATYIGGGHNITLRNNRLIRNSVVNGTCTGGNMTFHGQIEGLTIEGNEIVQDAAAPSCYGVSITRGYATAEWFRNAVVRGNLVKNVPSGVVAQSAPGIVVEDNVMVDSGFSIGSGPNPGTGGEAGDVGDTDARVVNNTLCRRSGSAGVSVNSGGAVVTNNVVRTGTDATTGVCAR